MTDPFDIEDDDLDEDLVDDETHQDDAPEPRFADVAEWVEGYFRHVVAGPYANKEVPGSRTWCPQWWRHRAVAVPLAALHNAWESARISDDPAAMSAWWVHHAHPHIRWLCDAQSGPMYRCSASRGHASSHDHTEDESLEVIPAPQGWFSPPAPAAPALDDEQEAP